jgi:uncharacterized protein YndB with AHSA1/START domain
VSREVTKTLTINAPADVVWRALTEADQLSRWFPVDARVTPGVGGSIWISWGDGAAGEAPITAWEPGRRLQWTEDRGAVKIAVDFHLETRGGTTVVRLVQSGFGDGPEWDDEFHMVDAGWAYFTFHLQWYLERHRDVPRDLIGFREQTQLDGKEAFSRLRAIVADLDLQQVVDSRSTNQAGYTIASLNDAVLFIEIEPGAKGVRGGFWLSTYGLPRPELESLRERISRAYDDAIRRV